MEQAIQTQTHMVWGLEHPLVYTSGLKTETQHILEPSIEPIRTRRGGSVTLHNPGQLVIYFAFPLEAVDGGLERFVRIGEAVMGELLLQYGVPANLSPGASGIFTEKGKIAFIGLGLKKNFIFHGFSINVTNDMKNFRAIQSCGLTLPMTRIADLIESAPTTQALFTRFLELFSERFEKVEPHEFRRRAEARHNFKDWKLGFKLGWLYFHERRYWEAHEIWEMFWHEMEMSEERLFMHAMIQVAMAWYKIFTVTNLVGAESLLTKALEKLAVVKAVVMLRDQDALIAFLAQSLAAVKVRDGSHSKLVPPVFAFV